MALSPGFSHSSSPPGEARLEGVARGDVALADRAATADDVDAPLLRDVPERRDPGLAAVPGGGDVDLDPHGVEGVARQRHVVLPADEAAHPAERQVVDGERAAVPLAVHQPLAGGGDELPVLAEEA